MSLTLLTALATLATASLPNAEGLQDGPPLEPADFRFTPADPVEVISLGALAENQTDQEPSVEQGPAPFGEAESWRIYLHGGGGVHIKDGDNKLAQFGVGFGYFMARDLSLDFELNGLYFDQVGDDAAGANFNLLFRWHFLSEQDWSVYLDAGAGLLGTTNDVPEHGSSFNFTPQAGLGITYDIGNNNRLMAGVRWHHVSNGSTYEENPGRDSVMVYLGLSMPF